MKYRMGFVTNSSSSSYLCVFKVEMCEELEEYIREEFGRHGNRLLESRIFDGDSFAEILHDDYGLEEEDMGIDIDKDGSYLIGEFVEWTNEGDHDDDGAVLSRYIPDEYIEEIYNGQY